MYVPSGRFRRTPAERADQQLSWVRSDAAFFAAGACHILAFAFVAAHPDFSIRALRKRGEPFAFHVFATDGAWAFDHDGWTPESELISVTSVAELPAELETLDIPLDLVRFCADHHSRLPEDFAHDPWPRARAYIARFPAEPPRHGSPALKDPPV